MERWRNKRVLRVCLIAVLFACSIAAIFDAYRASHVAAEDQYINIHATTGGVVTVSATGPSIQPITDGYSIAFSSLPDTTPLVDAQANSGYAFDKYVSTRGTSTVNSAGSTTTFGVTTDDNIVAMFVPVPANPGSTFLRRIYYSNNGNSLVRISAPSCTDTNNDGACIKAGEYVMQGSSTHGAPIGAVAEEFSGGNYALIGWFNNSSGTGNPYTTSATFTPVSYMYGCSTNDCSSGWGSMDESYTFYAIYDTNPYTATYTNGGVSGVKILDNSTNEEVTTGKYWAQANGGNGASKNLVVKVDPNSVPANKRFARWEDENNTSVTTNTTLDISSLGTGIDGKTYHPVFEDVSTYTIQTNDSTLGLINTVDGSCGSNSVVSDTTQLTAGGELNISSWGVLACPGTGYTFDHWSLDIESSDINVGSNTSISKNGYNWPDDGQPHTLTAVFRDPNYTVTIYAGNGTAALSAGQNYTVSDSGTSTVTLRSTETNNVTTSAITVTPPSGYIVNPSNPVTDSGNVTYNGNYNANDGTFTITFNGSGSATINYVVDPHYTVTIDAGSGTAAVSGNQNYTVSGSGSSSVALTAENSNVTTSTITVTPPSGYRVDTSNPVTITPNNSTTAYNNDLSNNTFTLTLNDAATVTINYELIPGVTTYVISPDDPTHGCINTTSGWCDTSTSTTGGETVSLVNGALDASSGNIVACANSGYIFSHWLIDETTTVTQNGNVVGSSLWTGLPGQENWPDDGQQHTLEAIFIPTYTVTVVSDDSTKGQVNITTGTGYTANPSNSNTDNIAIDTAGTITLENRLLTVPATGYYIDHFTYDNSKTTLTEFSGAGDQWVVTLSGADTITAYWSAYADTLYDVSVNIPSAGSIDIQNTDCSTSTNQTFTKSLVKVNYYKSTLDTNGHDIIACVDDSNYYFSHWLIDGMNVSRDPVLDDEGYWPKGVTSNHHTLQAVFVPKVTINVVSDDSDGSTHGSISVTSGTGYTVTQNSNTSSTITTASGTGTTTQTVTLTADNGYIFDHFESANGNVAWTRGNTWNEYTLTISGTGNDTVTAFFEPATDASVDDTTQGYISYWDNDAGQTVNLDNNQPYTASSEVLDGTRYIKGTVGNFWAMPRNGYTFDHWELNGDFVVSPNGGAVESRNIQYQPGENGNNPQLVAFFRDYSLFHVFTGYNDAHGYFDHYLPETQRTNNDGAQAGALQLDGDGLGATTVRSNDTHSTAPNGYYFAYWITGCDSSFLFHEPVETAPGHSDEMNVLGRETIMTTNTYFRPTDEQKSQCSEYVAVWYRVNQQRLIASSENEAIGTVQSHTDTGSSTYGICGRVDQGTSRLMRTIANMGIYDTANGLSIDCYPYAVITNPSYEVDYWTLNGDVLYENGDIFSGMQVRKRTYTKSDGSALTIYGNQLNNLVAHYRLKELPYTGSSIILVIIIGGIGAVAIPSAFLILSERKERKKGGKK